MSKREKSEYKRDESDHKVEKSEKKRKKSEQGEKNKKLSAFAEKHDIKARQQVLILMYKDIYLSTNDLNSSLPSIILSLLQDFKDQLLEEIPYGLPLLRRIEHQIDFTH